MRREDAQSRHCACALPLKRGLVSCLGLYNTYVCITSMSTCMVVSRLAALMLPSEWHVVVVSNCYSNKITRVKKH